MCFSQCISWRKFGISKLFKNIILQRFKQVPRWLKLPIVSHLNAGSGGGVWGYYFLLAEPGDGFDQGEVVLAGGNLIVT